MTLMIYMIGSDLESGSASATADLEEMRSSGVDFDQVNILVYTGGSKKWHSDEIPADRNGLFRLTKDGLTLLQENDLKSMGESATLTDFLNDCCSLYPAEHYGLILWNHGNGPLIGYGMDKQHKNDALTLNEIKEALKDSPFGKKNKLDFIGFDACLMSSAELICTVDDYADYLIASQEVEPSFGWNYDFLSGCGKGDTKSFVSSIIDSYVAYCTDYFKDKKFFSSDVTLAAMDLSYGTELEDALNRVFEKAATDVSGDYPKLAAERIQTRGLGRATTGSEYDLVDVEDLMRMMSERYPKDTDAVLDILSKMVVKNGTNTTGCSGFSLYYPYYNKKYYTSSWKETYQELGLFPDYLTYLSRYEEIWLGTDMQEFFDGALVPSEKAKGEYTLQLTEEQEEHYAMARYFILRRTGDELYSPVFTSTNVTNKKGLLKAEFDGKVIYVEFDDDGSDHIPITKETDSIDGKTYYNAWPSFYNDLDNSISGEMQLELDSETGEITVKSLLSTEKAEDADALQGGKRKEINPDDWKLIQFYDIQAAYITRDENGKLLPFFEWQKGDWYTGVEHYASDGFRFVYKPMYDDGNEYYLIFEVYDVQNNCYTSELLPITLEKAPKTEKKRNIVSETAMDASGTAVLYEEQNLKAELLMVKNGLNGAENYLVRFRNQRDVPVRLSVNSMTMNDQTDIFTGTVWIDANPGEEVYHSLRNIPQSGMFSGNALPEKLELAFEIREIDSGKAVLKDSSAVVSFEKDADFREFWLPALDAMAEEQEICRTDSLSVRLLRFGYMQDMASKGPDAEDARITYVLELENLSEEEHIVRVDGLYLNGLFMENMETAELQPGQKRIFTGTASLSSLRESGITSISSLEYSFTMDPGEGTVTAYPVRLSASGKADPFQPEGRLIYSDDNVEIFYTDYSESESFTGDLDCIWRTYIRNKSDENIEISLTDIELNGETGYVYGFYAGRNLVPAGSVVYYPVTANYQEEKPQLNAAFVWTNESDLQEELGRTELFNWRDL